jgi:hypothetical protein
MTAHPEVTQNGCNVRVGDYSSKWLAFLVGGADLGWPRSIERS